MVYTTKQLRTLLKYAEDRSLPYVYPEHPPAEVCKRLRHMYGRYDWCTLLRGPCQCDTNGCLRLEVKETEA